eukprot:3640665-Alexandrium_andersonii.AAC.1
MNLRKGGECKELASATLFSFSALPLRQCPLRLEAAVRVREHPKDGSRPSHCMSLLGNHFHSSVEAFIEKCAVALRVAKQLRPWGNSTFLIGAA